jgi:hypothetical protein
MSGHDRDGRIAAQRRSWPRVLGGSLALCFGIALLSAKFNTTATTDATLDFPEVVRGDFVTSDLAAGNYELPHAKIVNRTQAPFTVSLKYKSCNCVGVLVDGEPFAVGEAFAVPVGSSRSISIPLSSGHRGSSSFRLRFLAESDRNAAREHDVSVQLNTWPDLVVTPALLEISNTARAKKTVQVERYWRGNAEAALPPVLNGGDNVKLIEVCASDHDSGPLRVSNSIWKRTWTFSIECSDSAATNGRTDVRQVQIESALRDGGVLLRSLQLRFADKARIFAPELVHFGTIRVGEARTRQLPLRETSGQPFRILSVQCDQTIVRGTLNAGVSPSQLQTIEVTCSPAADAVVGRVEGTLVIETDDPEQHEIRIPVIALIEPPATTG